MSIPIHSYKDLLVWRIAMELVVEIYKITSLLPSNELFGLTSQMKRAAISIPSNIAEGRHQSTRNDFRQFLYIAYGFVAELETQLEITRRLQLLSEECTQNADSLLLEVKKMINAMLSNFNSKNLR